MDVKLDDIALLNLLRQRDEVAFTNLVEQYHASLARRLTVAAVVIPSYWAGCS